MTPEFADVLITYLEELERRTNHQSVLRDMYVEHKISTDQLDAACRALGQLAGRDYSIL